MRRLIMSINVTLDGCCDHAEVIADAELHRYANDLAATLCCSGVPDWPRLLRVSA